MRNIWLQIKPKRARRFEFEFDSDDQKLFWLVRTSEFCKFDPRTLSVRTLSVFVVLVRLSSIRTRVRTVGLAKLDPSVQK